MRTLRTLTLALPLLLSTTGCFEFTFPSEVDLLPGGNPFVISGTAAILDQDGPCLVWIGDNGVTYHLFQDPSVSNDDFDRITTPGVRARLEIMTRNDLVVSCPIGTIVEVQRVLEIVD